MSRRVAALLRAITGDVTREGLTSLVDVPFSFVGPLPRCSRSNVADGLIRTVSSAAHIHKGTLNAGTYKLTAGRQEQCTRSSLCHVHHGHSLHRARTFHSSAAPGSSDYYETLGIPKSASDGEVKKAYYKLAKRYHPDANPGNEDAKIRFQQVQEAYDILRDPQKRAMYDQLGHRNFQDSGASDGGGYPGGDGYPGGFEFRAGPGGFSFGGGFGSNMEDVIHDMAKEFFGRGGRSSMYSSFQVSTTASISFMDALKGTSYPIQLSVGDEIVETRVDIPPGVENGQQLFVQDVVRSRQNRIQVQGHRNFVRKGADIFSKLELKLTEALLGCQKEVETAWGRTSVNVPPGSAPLSKISLDGWGAPRLKSSGYGRHVLELILKLPKRLSTEQMEAVERLRLLGM